MTDQADLPRESYLIQRLESPYGGSLLGKDNPFSFGGGLRNGGLSDDAMDLLRDVFSFDYMGAAEFEFGAVPKALSALANKATEGSLVAFDFDILLSKVRKPWDEEANPPAPRAKATIYVICPAGWTVAVEERIKALAGNKPPRTKEAVNLHSVLRPGRYEYRVRGWLELDNGFMFFTDRPMWEATATLFGIEVNDG